MARMISAPNIKAINSFIHKLVHGGSGKAPKNHDDVFTSIRKDFERAKSQRKQIQDLTLPDLRQQFLDAFVGPSPSLPSASEYLQPFDRAASDLAAQYAAARDAISARTAAVPAQIQQNIANNQQLLALQNQATQQANAQAASQAAGTSADIQSRAAALGGNSAALAAQAGLQQDAAGRAADNRSAFMAQMQAIQQQAANNAGSAAQSQGGGALGYLDANRLKAQQQIDQGRAQAQMAYNNQSNQLAQQQHAQRLAAVKALTDLEESTSPVKFLRDSLLPQDDMDSALALVQAIEDGSQTPEQVLAQLKKLSAEAKNDPSNTTDYKAISTAIRKAYVSTRREREKLLKQLGGKL